MKMIKKAKVNKQKKLVVPFVTGAAIGAAAGLLLAKKSGEELIEDLGDNLEAIKEKAKDAYENKDEIIDNVERKIKNITKSEIKNFVEPEYYSKEFDIEDVEIDKARIDEILKDADEAKQAAADKLEEAAENVKDKVKDTAEEVKDTAKDVAKDLKKDVKETKEEAKNLAEDIKDKVKDKAEDVKDAAEDITKEVKKDAKEVKKAAKKGKEELKDTAEAIADEVKDVVK